MDHFYYRKAAITNNLFTASKSLCIFLRISGQLFPDKYIIQITIIRR